jgi:D-glycero-alpha-D-manno-heptose-7-phosphate kinase
MSSFNICKLALDIERQFNPLTGRQDTFGCGLGGFKRIEFFKNKNTIARPLDDDILSNCDIYLIYTGVKRSSTKILKSLNFKKVKKLVPLVNDMENAIQKKDEKSFFKIIQDAWDKKRKTSKLIQSNLKILELDAALKKCNLVKAHRLCGAGGGGYYLAFTDRGSDLSCHIKNFNKISFKINVDDKGVTHTIL